MMTLSAQLQHGEQQHGWNDGVDERQRQQPSRRFLVRGEVDDRDCARYENDQATDRVQHGKNLEFTLALKIGNEIELPGQVDDQADISQQRQVVKQKAFQFIVQP